MQNDPNVAVAEERETKLLLLEEALIAGEESGIADYSLESLIAELDSEVS